MKTNQVIGILSHNIGLFSFLITNNDSLDSSILISLLPEGKSLKIASKQGFLAPGLEKWTRILVKNGRSSTPVLRGKIGEKKFSFIWKVLYSHLGDLLIVPEHLVLLPVLLLLLQLLLRLFNPCYVPEKKGKVTR